MSVKKSVNGFSLFFFSEQLFCLLFSSEESRAFDVPSEAPSHSLHQWTECWATAQSTLRGGLTAAVCWLPLSQVPTTLISNSTVNLQVAWKLDSIPPFANIITVFCANICSNIIKFNIRVLKNAAYSLIYLKMHIKCANVPNSTPFKSCYRLLGFTMRNLGSYPRKVAASSQAPWLALNVKDSSGRLVLTEVQNHTRGGGNTQLSECGHVPSPGIYHSCLHVKWLC